MWLMEITSNYSDSKIRAQVSALWSLQLDSDRQTIEEGSSEAEGCRNMSGEWTEFQERFDKTEKKLESWG